MKRALPQEFLDKTTDEAVKRLRSSSITEFKAKGEKIRSEANSEILEKINQAIRSIEKANMEKCQELMRDGKKLLLKQQKLIRIADREEDCCEVVKCCLPDDLASNLDDEKQLLRARREAASDKKKQESAKQKYRKKPFRNASQKKLPLQKKLSLQECELDRDWEHSENCNELVSVRDD